MIERPCQADGKFREFPRVLNLGLLVCSLTCLTATPFGDTLNVVSIS